jgi:hypothetical protein
MVQAAHLSNAWVEEPKKGTSLGYKTTIEKKELSYLRPSRLKGFCNVCTFRPDAACRHRCAEQIAVQAG